MVFTIIQFRFRFVLDQRNTLSCIFHDSASSLKQQSVGRHVARLEHINLIPNQPAFDHIP